MLENCNVYLDKGRGNSPRDLVDNRVPEISRLGFSCVRMKGMAVHFRESQFLQEKAASYLSR
jgi:hypothetical protein